MIIRPISIREAMRQVARVHRRHPKMRGGMWALALLADNDIDLFGVATVGRPSRKLQRGALRLEVTRVAIGEGVPHGCSMLYGACARTARAMGATDLLTYTHLDEPGTSLKAAGWIADGHVTDDEDWDRPSRPRKGVSGKKTGPKRRWWAPWSELLPEMIRKHRDGECDCTRQQQFAEAA